MFLSIVHCHFPVRGISGLNQRRTCLVWCCSIQCTVSSWLPTLATLGWPPPLYSAINLAPPHSTVFCSGITHTYMAEHAMDNPRLWCCFALVLSPLLLLTAPPYAVCCAADASAGCRCATWADRLHEDAFGEDLLGNLVKMTASRHHRHLTAAGSGTHTTAAESAVHAAGQQQGVSAHTAAAVMAAVTAVKASLFAGPPLPAEAMQQQGEGTTDFPGANTHHNPSSNAAPGLAARCLSYIVRAQDAAAAAAGSTSGDAAPAAPSFLQALMAGGGVIHPPNVPPIPLNVDFGSEVQLGRLLGRGGFGHVYEASWRGQQVRRQSRLLQQQRVWLLCCTLPRPPSPRLGASCPSCA
jgi:hypothetical protein